MHLRSIGDYRAFYPIGLSITNSSRGYVILIVITLSTMVKAMKLKVTTVGNSTGVILPKELLEKLRIGKGDTLFVTETTNGVELSPYDKELAYQMEVVESIMREDRDVLRKLAE